MRLEKRKRMDSRKGYGMLGLLVAISALALMFAMFTKWYMGLSKTTEDPEEKLEMQSLVQDRLNQINALTFDELSEKISSSGTTWTEDVGGKYEIRIDFGEVGKYVDGACVEDSSSGRPCRAVSLSVSPKDSPGVSQSIKTKKIATLSESEKIQNLKNKVAAAEAKFSSYYTAAEINSKFAQFYTKTEFDKKLEESGGAIPSSSGSFALSGYGSLTRSFTTATFCNFYVTEASSLVISGKTLHTESDNEGTFWQYFPVFVPKGGYVSIGGNTITGYCFPT